MPVNVLADPQYTAPSAADGITLTPPGVAWTNSAWSEIIAATDAACILTGISIRLNTVTTNEYGIEIDVGTGAAASEVVIATFRAQSGQIAANVGQDGCYIQSVIGIDNIANGARLAVRVRAGHAAAVAQVVALTYLKKPLTGTMLTTANPLICTPSAANALDVTGGGLLWENGTWVQVRAASGPAINVVGIVAHSRFASEHFELDLGIGTAGAEVVTDTVRAHNHGANSFPNVFRLPNPLTIGAALRIAVRARVKSSLGVTPIRFALSYFNSPL